MLKTSLGSVLLLLVGFMLTGAFLHHPPEKPLAVISFEASGEQPFTVLKLDRSRVQKDLGNGFQVKKIGLHYLEGTYYLVRGIEGPNGKKGTLFSELRQKSTKLYPVLIPQLKFACWQILTCPCERPTDYGKCSCNGHGDTDGCSLEDGPKTWDYFFDPIFIF